MEMRSKQFSNWFILMLASVSFFLFKLFCFKTSFQDVSLTDLINSVIICCSLRGTFDGSNRQPKLKLEEAIEKYINYCIARGLRPHVIKAKKRHLSYFVEYCDKPLIDVTLDDIFEFIKNLELGEDPKFRTVQDLRCSFKYFQEIGLTTLPWTLIQYKEPESKPIIAMTFDEFQLIDKFFKDQYKKTGKRRYIRYRAMHNALWSLGCRRNELVNIELVNLDLNNGRCFFKAEKGNGFRIGKFFTGTESIKQYIKVWKPKTYLFPCCSNTVAEMLYEAKEALNLRSDLSLHSYRSGLITWLHLVKEISLKIIQEYIGHKKLETTASYVRNDTETILSKIGECFIPEKKMKSEINLFSGTLTLETKYKRNKV